MKRREIREQKTRHLIVTHVVQAVEREKKRRKKIKREAPALKPDVPLSSILAWLGHGEHGSKTRIESTKRATWLIGSRVRACVQKDSSTVVKSEPRILSKNWNQYATGKFIL